MYELGTNEGGALSWQERALCAQTDPEAFFPEKGGSTREAKKVCLACEVRGECHKEEPIIVDDEHFQWRFNGEYWKDELGYYRFKIRSRCAK